MVVCKLPVFKVKRYLQRPPCSPLMYCYDRKRRHQCYGPLALGTMRVYYEGYPIATTIMVGGERIGEKVHLIQK